MKFTRTLMDASALLMGALGLGATFAPDVMLRVLDAPAEPLLMLAIQVLGALYLGFAALNWMGRHSRIGGIYSRPLVVANLMHFLTAGIAMVRLAATEPVPWQVLAVTIAYGALAAVFGVVLRRHPPEPA